jgi:Domain of unknown function DUF11
MKAFTACPAKSYANRGVALSLRRKFVFWRWLVLALVAISLLGAGSCTTEELEKLGLLTPDTTAVAPASVPAGSPATSITITGTNLDNSPVVLLDNKMPLTITSATATQIGAIIPASDLTTSGTHQLTVIADLPGGPLTSPSPLPFVVTSSTPAVVLAISKSPVGTFTQGGTGSYTIMVSDTGSAPTDGSQVTVAELPPQGLTVTNMSGGTTWNCIMTTGMCTRSDVLQSGASYPPITVTVAVATNAPSMVTNEATVSGGGAPTATAMAPTTIGTPGASQLGIGIVTSSPTFAPNSTDTYTITVSNTGTAATSGTITVAISLDMNEILGSMGLSGTGWTCNNTTLTCTNPTSIGAGQSLNPINVPVDVLANDESQVTITVTASGSGSTAMKTNTTPT